MSQSDSSREDGQFFVSAWCPASKAWHDQPGQYESSWQAQAAATERGIYRVSYLRDDRRVDMEPFAIVGDDSRLEIAFAAVNVPAHNAPVIGPTTTGSPSEEAAENTEAKTKPRRVKKFL